MELLGYLKSNRKSFQEEAINHLDVLALTWITYFDMPKLVDHLPISIQEWKQEEIFHKIAAYHRSFVPKSSAKVIFEIASSPRFESLEVLDFHYQNDLKKKLQFGVIAYRLGEHIVIAFEGTDLSYAGWREDLEMAYRDSIASYPLAMSFIERIEKEYEGPIILSGHSKGGNIVSYCLAMMEDDSRIEKVYSYEGPGFHFKGIFKKHPERESKLVKFVPHTAFVGILLNDDSKVHIVKANAVGILQHNALKWEIKNNDFVYYEKRSLSSRFIGVSINRWIDSLTEEERQRFITLVLDNVEAFGPDEFEELYKRFIYYVPALSRAYGNLSKEDKAFFKMVMGRLRLQMRKTIEEHHQSQKKKRISHQNKKDLH